MLPRFEQRQWLLAELAELACYRGEGLIEQRRYACTMRQTSFGEASVVLGVRRERVATAWCVAAVVGALPRKREDVPCPAWNKRGARTMRVREWCKRPCALRKPCMSCPAQGL